jgi:hypothetical protein
MGAKKKISFIPIFDSIESSATAALTRKAQNSA